MTVGPYIYVHQRVFGVNGRYGKSLRRRARPCTREDYRSRSVGDLLAAGKLREGIGLTQLCFARRACAHRTLTRQNGKAGKVALAEH